MNSQNVYIIIIEKDRGTLLLSGLGFMYKYIMRPDIKNIILLRANESLTGCETLAEWSSESDQNIKVSNWSILPKNDNNDRFEQATKIRESAETKTYRENGHINSAIIVGHGIGENIARMPPEQVADFLVEMKENNKLPIFTKIVLDVCYSGNEHIPSDSAWKFKPGPNQLELNRIAALEEIAKRTRKQENDIKNLKNKKTGDKVSSTIYGEVIYPARSLVDYEFTVAFRFLNRYAKCSNGNDILIAGYDSAVTAAHPDKPGYEQFGLPGSGMKYDEKTKEPIANTRSEIKKCYIFMHAKNTITPLQDLEGWTDRR